MPGTSAPLPFEQTQGPAPTASARASAASSGTALSGKDSDDKSCKRFRFEQLENRKLTLTDLRTEECLSHRFESSTSTLTTLLNQPVDHILANTRQAYMYGSNAWDLRACEGGGDEADYMEWQEEESSTAVCV